MDSLRDEPMNDIKYDDDEHIFNHKNIKKTPREIAALCVSYFTGDFLYV